jgi:hypothetical protein
MMRIRGILSIHVSRYRNSFCCFSVFIQSDLSAKLHVVLTNALLCTTLVGIKYSDAANQ